MKRSLVPIGVSSCLLGNNVRFNGANAHKKLITETLSQIFSYHVICPEVFAGLGVPRNPIFLEKNDNQIIVKQHKSDSDLTSLLVESSNKLIEELPKLFGFILKKSSPSCGYGTVKLYNLDREIINNKSNGYFATELKKKYPLIPFEDEGRLNDPYLKEHFIKRVLLTYEAENILQFENLSQLIKFHTRHKILLRLHHPMNQKSLGRLVANCDEGNFDKMKSRYYTLFLSSFHKVAKKGNHYTILQRVLREINKLITKNERSNLQDTIKAFHQDIIPLVVPIEMIKHYLVKYDIEFLKKQSYLGLYPSSLGLMSHM